MNNVIYREMIDLESQGVYDLLHVFLLLDTPITPVVWTCHTCFIAYSYILIDGTDLI